PHGVHPQALRPTELDIDPSWIEGGCLPHLELVHRIVWDVVAAQDPGLGGIPLLRPLDRPALQGTCPRADEHESEQRSTDHRQRTRASHRASRLDSGMMGADGAPRQRSVVAERRPGPVAREGKTERATRPRAPANCLGTISMTNAI